MVRHKHKNKIGLRLLTGCQVLMISAAVLFISACAIWYSSSLTEFLEEEYLIAYYPLDGSASDMSGNGHDGNITGAVPASDRHGGPSGALHFDGSSYVEVPDTRGIELSGGGFTICLWMNPDILFPGNNMHMINTGLDGADGYAALSIRNGTNNPAFHIRDSALTWLMLDSGHGISVGAWYHVTGVWDGRRRRIYVNGVFCSEDGADIDPALYSGLKAVRFGCNTASLSNYYEGYLDEILIYSRALSDAEVHAVYLRD